MLAGLVDHLTEQQTTAIAQLRVVAAELVAGIDHRTWFRRAPELVAGEQVGEQRIVLGCRVEIEQGHGGFAGHYQARIFERLGRDFGRKNLAQLGEAVVEIQLGKRLHGGSGTLRFGALCGRALCLEAGKGGDVPQA